MSTMIYVQGKRNLHLKHSDMIHIRDFIDKQGKELSIYQIPKSWVPPFVKLKWFK